MKGLQDLMVKRYQRAKAFDILDQQEDQKGRGEGPENPHFIDIIHFFIINTLLI